MVTASASGTSTTSHRIWSANRKLAILAVCFVGLIAYDVTLLVGLHRYSLSHLNLALFYVLVLPAGVFLGMSYLISKRVRKAGFLYWLGATSASVISPVLVFYAMAILVIPVLLFSLLFGGGEWTQHCGRTDGPPQCSIYKAYNVGRNGSAVLGVNLTLDTKRSPAIDVYYDGTGQTTVDIRFAGEDVYQRVECLPGETSSHEVVYPSCPVPNAARLLAPSAPREMSVRLIWEGGETVRNFDLQAMRESEQDGVKRFPELKTR